MIQAQFQPSPAHGSHLLRAGTAIIETMMEG